MKKFILVFMLFALKTLCFSQDSIIRYSQDTVRLKKGIDISCKVISAGVDEVTYKKLSTGPSYIIQQRDIQFIKYGNGTNEVFSEAPIIEKKIEKHDEKQIDSPPSSDVSASEMFNRGVDDARKYYPATRCGATGTLVATLGVGLLAVVPALIISSASPSIKNLRMPNNGLATNESYVRGYTRGAHSIKRRKVWRSFGIGCLANVVLGVVLSSTY